MQGSEVAISGRERKERPSLSKSLLYGTSALAGVGLVVGGSTSASAQEDRIELALGGYLNSYMGFSDIDEADAETRDFNDIANHFEGEIFFDGKTVLETGLEVGAQVQLEVPTMGDQIDEAYLWVEGAFGQIQFGGENSAHYKMGLGTTTGVGVPINSGWVTDFVPPPPGFRPGFRAPSVSTVLDVHNDDLMITYYTPRVAGFQFGATYVPTANTDGSPTNGIADQNTDYHNGVAVGANWVGDFNGFELGVSGGYAWAQVPDVFEDAGADDLEQVMVGATIGFGGLSFHGAYANELEGRVVGQDVEVDGVIVPGLRSTEGQSWNATAIYEIGPWGVSVSYFHGETEDFLAIGGDDELDAYVGSVTYAIGPGVAIDGSVLYADYETDEGEEQDGYSIIGGMQLAF